MYYNDQIRRWGVKGMKWGIRHYQNKEGTLTEAGEKRYKRDVTANDKKKTAPPPAGWSALSAPTPSRWHGITQRLHLKKVEPFLFAFPLPSGTMMQKGSDKMPEVDVIRAQLFALQDKEYQAFYSRLMPTLPPETVIGVRVPLLRRLAKQLADTPEAEVFLQCLPHFYYEENALHAFLLEPVRDFGTALAATERFLPYVDNWAVCDSFSPKVFAQHKPELLSAIRRWLGSDQVYTVRYGIGMLMRYYLDDAFQPEYLAWVAAVHSEEYYVNMMRAWYFATALAKQPVAALPWLTEKRLDAWTHNKTIQKAVESRRITPEQKQALRVLRIRSQKLCEERRV